jgi:Uma2 family endonuclease
MATVLKKLGPDDHGRPMTFEEYMEGDYQEGYQYELIDGKLYVSPQPNMPGGFLETWILFKIQLYAREHPEVINYACGNARVFVPGRPGVTTPEPDAAAFSNFPIDMDVDEMRWEDFSPVVVAEVVGRRDPGKDLERNVELYHQVPSIKEYWTVDARGGANRPLLTARRRYGRRWREVQVHYGQTYTTRLLPGFELLVDPRR